MLVGRAQGHVLINIFINLGRSELCPRGTPKGEYLRCARTARYFYGGFTWNGLAFTHSRNAP